MSDAGDDGSRPPGWAPPPVPGPGGYGGYGTPPPTGPYGSDPYSAGGLPPASASPPPGNPYGQGGAAPPPAYPPTGVPPGAGYVPSGYTPYSPYGSYGYGTMEHPQGTTILVLGILGLVICGLLGPVAWVMGNNALAEIDAAPGRYSNRSTVQAGRIMGIIESVLLAIGFGFVVLAIILSASSTSG